MASTACNAPAVTLLSNPARSTVLPARRRPSPRGTRYPRCEHTTWRSRRGVRSKATMWPRTGSTGGGWGSPGSRPAQAPVAFTTTGAVRRSAPAHTPATRPPSSTRLVTGRPHSSAAPRATADAASARTSRTLSTARSSAKNRPDRTAGFRLGSASRISAALERLDAQPARPLPRGAVAQDRLLRFVERDLEHAVRRALHRDARLLLQLDGQRGVPGAGQQRRLEQRRARGGVGLGDQHPRRRPRRLLAHASALDDQHARALRGQRAGGGEPDHAGPEHDDVRSHCDHAGADGVILPPNGGRMAEAVKGRCVHCRADILVPDSYHHGDHVKCGQCGTRHKVSRGEREGVRLVLADVGPLRDALKANEIAGRPARGRAARRPPQHRPRRQRPRDRGRLPHLAGRAEGPAPVDRPPLAGGDGRAW